MPNDQENNLPREDSAPEHASGKPEGFSAPKFILPEEDSSDDFVVDVPAHAPMSPEAFPEGTAETPPEVIAEAPPPAGEPPEADPAPPELPSEPEDAPPEPTPEEEKPAQKGLFGLLAGLRLRFGAKKEPGEAKEKKPKKEKPPKQPKQKKEKERKSEPEAPPGDSGEELIDPSQEGAGVAVSNQAAKPTAKPRPKKEQAAAKAAQKPASSSKKKPKAAKKPKPAKAAKKTKAPAEGKKSSKKFIIIAGAVVLAAAVAVLFLFVLKKEGPEDFLLKAQEAAGAGSYEAARELYAGLLEDETYAADAYLGIAETLIVEEDVEGAVSKLELGFELTGDPRLQERLLEVRPEPSPDQGDAPPAAPAYSAEPIAWQDPALEALVRAVLGKPAGHISESDLSEITTFKILGPEHVSISADGLNSINTMRGYTLAGVEYTARGEIKSLADFAHFKNLRRLTVGYNQVAGLTGLESLTKLELLALYVNEVEDLTPVANLTSLKNLYLYGNKIEDISPLKALTGLRALSVQHNQITDLSALSGMTLLRELYISNNQITDIAPLKDMGELIFLGAQGNGISDIGVLAGLTKLTDINFTANPVVDFSPAAHVGNKQSSFA